VNPLQIFPAAGFDRSTTTPVLLGVLLSWFFTETFGWVFAGLVVPGYLAAVFAIDPRAGMVDVATAIFTYGLARGIGEHLPRTGLTSRVFGRERFLLIVLCSIVVRLAVEGAILPRFAPHAAGSFFSIGLVVVPLAANACWKTGLGKGLIQNGVPTLLCFLILKFVLLPHTNLSLAGFELATEDVAASFLASPKAYILLITGAILAASANVLDGWDFNGILIPALLALVVLEPVKFGATFVEALVIVAIATVLVRTTRLGRANIEGPRRLVLFFSIDYAMRFAFAGLVGRSLPGGDVVGLMGFGYLLPTLLAVKIAQRGSAPLVLLPTAHVGVSAFALGTLIGFSAAVVDTDSAAARTPVTRPLPRTPADPEAAAFFAAGLTRTAPHEGKGPSPLSGAPLVELVDQALDHAEHDREGDGAGPYAVQRLDRGVILLRERFEHIDDRWGDPTILATTAWRAVGRRLVLLVPAPAAAPETAALAGRMVAEGRADLAVIAGVDEGVAAGPFSNAALDAARTLANRTKRDVAKGDGGKATDGDQGVVVAIRRGNGKAARAILGARANAAARVDALFLGLEGTLGAITRELGERELGDRDVDVVLELPDDAVARLFPTEVAPSSLGSPAAISTLLDDVRATTRESSPEELLVERRLLLDPLLSPKGAQPASLPLLRVTAARLGYALHGPGPLGGGGEVVVLVPSAQGSRPLSVVVRTTGVSSTVVEVPQGFREGMRDLGLRIATRIGADAAIFGLEHGGAARGGPALRLAHAVATAPSAGGSEGRRAAQVVVLREAADDGTTARGVVGLGAWGGAGREGLLASVRQAFGAVGLEVEDRPLDLAARELGGRAIFGEVPLVAATLDATAIRIASLDEARGNARVLSTIGLPTIDASLADAARRLAGTIADGTPSPSQDVVALARQATLERSVVARRALASATASSATRAALVRTKAGDYVLLVARDTPKAGKSTLLATAIATDARAPKEDAAPTAVASLDACTAILESGGSCRAPMPLPEAP
jgi:hypothetical protein